MPDPSPHRPCVRHARQRFRGYERELLLDKPYTDTPYYGMRRMTAWLQSQGYPVNHKRVARLLHTMGIEAIYPKPHLSQGHPTHRVYPYLLRGVPITRVNHVWSTDITYIRLHGGFICSSAKVTL